MCRNHIYGSHSSEDSNCLTANKSRQKCGREYRKLHFERVYHRNVGGKSNSVCKGGFACLYNDPLQHLSPFLGSWPSHFYENLALKRQL